MRILISGASIAGPVLAYWLTRHGFDVTIVERAPQLRKTGGHAVDLFRPAMEISEKMGVLPRIEALATGTDTATICREGTRRPVRVDLTKAVGAVSDRHVEIMRDDLSEAYYDAGRDDVEYIFGDSITAISPDAEVTFEHARATQVRRWWSAPTGCTRTFGAWSSATTPDTPSSSAGTWRWSRRRKRLRATER